MTEVKVGEWYADGSLRLFCAGIKTCGTALMESRIGIVQNYSKTAFDNLEHLPDCTGWDWQEETFPQYWSATQIDYAFVRRDSETITHGVQKNGNEVCWETAWTESCEFLRTLLTEAEALALLDPKPQPAKDPEEWVEITDQEHVLRRGVDHYLSEILVEWTPVCESDGETWGKSRLSRFRVRCRRKDLPAKPKPRRTVTVPKWLVRIGSLWKTHENTDMPQGFDEVHRVGETTYEIEG